MPNKIHLIFKWTKFLIRFIMQKKFKEIFMKILEVSLPSKVQISNYDELEVMKSHILNKGFAIFDQYKDATYESICSIQYDFNILLAIIQSV